MPASPRRLEKRDRAEQVPVIGERDGAHTHPLGGLDEILDPDRAVEKAVLRMVVKVYETRGRHAAVLLQSAILSQSRTPPHSYFPNDRRSRRGAARDPRDRTPERESRAGNGTRRIRIRRAPRSGSPSPIRRPRRILRHEPERSRASVLKKPLPAVRRVNARRFMTGGFASVNIA